MTVVRVVQILIIVLTIAVIAVLSLLAKRKKLNLLIAIATSFFCFLVSTGICVILTLIEPPFFDVRGKESVVIPVFSEYEEAGAVAYYQGLNVSNRIAVSGEVDTSKVGNYSIEYTFSHGGYFYYAKREVSVVDAVAPEINLKGDREQTAPSIKLFKDPGFTATDNYDGDVSKGVKKTTEKLGEGQYKLIYTVEDSSGNIGSDYRIINVTDKVAPKINITGGNYLLTAKNSNFSLPGVSATDNIDGDVSETIKTEGSVDTTVVGVQSISYTAEDTSGNICTTRLQVLVYEPYVSGESMIFLTFDDGPSEKVTPVVLDTLKRNNIRATFFINDYSADKQHLIDRIMNEGHTLAVHGTSHNYAEIYKDTASCVANITTLRDKIFSATGYLTNVMRFPGGSSNTISKNYSRGVVSASAKQLVAEGWRYFDWNVDSGDADGSMSRNYIINNTVNQLKKGRANVVLMHDYYTKATTAEALQSIIDYGLQNGFTFEAINPSTPDVRHTIVN